MAISQVISAVPGRLLLYNMSPRYCAPYSLHPCISEGSSDFVVILVGIRQLFSMSPVNVISALLLLLAAVLPAISESQCKVSDFRVQRNFDIARVSVTPILYECAMVIGSFGSRFALQSQCVAAVSSRPAHASIFLCCTEMEPLNQPKNYGQSKKR